MSAVARWRAITRKTFQPSCSIPCDSSCASQSRPPGMQNDFTVASGKRPSVSPTSFIDLCLLDRLKFVCVSVPSGSVPATTLIAPPTSSIWYGSDSARSTSAFFWTACCVKRIPIVGAAPRWSASERFARSSRAARLAHHEGFPAPISHQNCEQLARLRRCPVGHGELTATSRSSGSRSRRPGAGTTSVIELRGGSKHEAERARAGVDQVAATQLA